jgi:hypothetical protein
MKFNKWTLGLAAVGLVSLTSAARADETKMSQVQTALSNTTLSGYVDASAEFTPGGGGNGAFTPNYNLGNKANQINLNVVDIALDKPLDEAPWASGYHVEMWLGPDGSTLGTTSGGSATYIRQAYIALRTPVGNGIDWKVGVFDTTIGYEGLTSGNNPNYSHSYGFNIEPTTHTGVLAAYKAFDWLTMQAGVADTSFNGTAYTAAINNPGPNGSNGGLSNPTFMWGPTLTAPESWGWAKGGTLSIGTINTSTGTTGAGATTGAQSYYAGITVPTPIAKLKFGGSFDYLNVRNGSTGVSSQGGNIWNIAGYSTYAFNDKLSLNLRGEHLSGTSYLNGGAWNNTSSSGNNAADEITATVQYNLWENVLSRVEMRWDHVEHGAGYASTSSSTGSGGQEDAWLFAAQVIYTF